MGPRSALAVLGLIPLIALAACSREGETHLPDACRQGGQALRTALRSAPQDVRLAGGTPISSCLDDTAPSGELREVGMALLDTAAALTAAASERPNGPEATQLGYLIGATRRRAAPDEGVNGEMARRLEQELLRVDTGSSAFQRGLSAGRAGG